MNVMSEGRDMQRGDRVYYRGDVWTVSEVINPGLRSCWLELTKTSLGGFNYITQAMPGAVQRVEQIR